MTTTDARARRTAPRLNLSGREWKLYLLGALGLVYAASFSTIANRARPDVPQAPPIASTPRTPARDTVGVNSASAAVIPGAVTASRSGTGQVVARAPRILTRTS